MGSVLNRGGSWVVEWKDATGRYRQKRTKCRTKAEARRMVEDLERQAERQRLGLEPLPAERQHLTFGELMDCQCPGRLLYPRPDGSMHKRDVAADKILRRAMGRAGAVLAYQHRCRRHGCGFKEERQASEPSRCPRCGGGHGSGRAEGWRERRERTHTAGTWTVHSPAAPP